MAQTQDDRTKTTFISNIADVSLSHLLELMIALSEYREGLVLIGGWVPYLLLKHYQPSSVDFQHIGSKDIDIAVNPKIVDESGYASILEILKQRSYEPKLDIKGNSIQHSFVKNVTTNRGEGQIQIDFLGPEYGGTKKSKRHQRIQNDFLVRKARGVDVMFDHAIDVVLEGKLPDGAEGQTTIKMANIVGIMTMKGIVVGSRYKQKDAYDIHSLILYYKSGPLAVAKEVRPFIDHGLVKEALESIHEKFRSREAEGPSWVADFLEATDELREQIKTQAYLQVQRFLTALYELPQISEEEGPAIPEEIPDIDRLREQVIKRPLNRSFLIM
ncbi:nucleotidyltransferase domain-containing protein [Patescibacteria group bacterium]|nr:nucleotidyltransferase domain-containing protein [Patescibacteria group bacterium]